MEELKPYGQKWNAVLTIIMEVLFTFVLHLMLVVSIVSGVRPENIGASIFFLFALFGWSAGLCCSLFVLQSYRSSRQFWKELGCPVIDFGVYNYRHGKRGMWFIFVNPAVYPNFGLIFFHNLCRVLWLVAVLLAIFSVAYALDSA